MTTDLQSDCLTWNYRNEPPAYVQRQIDQMSGPELPYEEPAHVQKPRRPGIGQKKDYGYTVPDVINGKPTGEITGGVKEALVGWNRGSGSTSGSDTYGLDFRDERQNNGGGTIYKENMFDLLAHTGLAENSGAARSNSKSAGPAKPPRDPRKNVAYVNRTNAIAEKYNKVQHKPWKMARFENVPSAVSSFRGREKAGQAPGEAAGGDGLYDPVGAPDYTGLDGKPLSPEGGHFITSQMEDGPPAAGGDPFAGVTADEKLFDV